MKTVSLELARQLKEAGYPQDTYFEWFDCHGNFSLEKHISDEFHGDDDKNYFAAPVADEIVDVLLREIKKKHTAYWLCIEPANLLEGTPSESKGFAVGYRNNMEWMRPFFEELSIADAAAKVYLHLEEKRLL
jgi:hypothetical protein